MTDFAGKGSRRVFAARLLREVQAQSALSGTLVPQIAALPAGALVSTDRLPAVSVGGVGKTLTPANFLSYILPDADKGDITTSASGATWTIDAGAVGYAKMQDVSAASRLLGRGSAGGAGDVEELTLGTGLSLAGTVLNATATGDVVGPASATDNAVARYNLTTGKLIQDSLVTIGDTGILNSPQAISITRTPAADNSDLLVMSNYAAGAFPYAGFSTDVNNVNGGGFWNMQVNAVTEASVQYNSTSSPNVGLAISTFTAADLRFYRNSALQLTLGNGTNTFVGTAVVNAGSTSDALDVTTTGAVQGSFRYDASNRLAIQVSSTGVVTFNALGTAPYISFADYVAMNVTAPSGGIPAASFGATTTTAATDAYGLRGLSIANHVSGTLGTVVGSSGLSQVTGAGGTTTLAVAFKAEVSRTAGTLTTGIGLLVESLSSTMTNAYGLRVNAVTGGSSLNYAIYTDSGLVRFGDAVESTSTITGTSLIGTTRVTAPLLGTTTATDVVFDRNSVTQLTLGSLLATFAGAVTVGGNVNFSGNQALSFRVENRTDDTGCTEEGRLWLRTDL